MGHNLLIVDDSNLSRANLTTFFEYSGDSVSQASTGEAALALMAQQTFDVVISDLRLPGNLNGIDVLKHYSKLRPRSGLILVTAFGSNEVRSEAGELGALYYEKPISLVELHAAVNSFPTGA